MQVWFWLLLPVAAASGWWAARHSQRKQLASSKALLNSAYGQGLNYLLNEEPDKATEVLIQMVEVDPDTVELHLALGSLFRRRGETDRAIRVHRNIIARSRLSDALRAQATLELGRDFLRAGLLDRAEKLFFNLLDSSRYEKEACQHLVDLYQKQKEWRQAIEFAGRLAELDADAWQPRVAQYYCELGDAALQRGDTDDATVTVDKALDCDPACVRATLLKGRIAQTAGDYRAALAAYGDIEAQNPRLLPEALNAIRDCYTHLGDMAGWQAYRDGLARTNPDLFASGATVPEQQDERELRYCCEKCGFASKRLFWQCPGCQCWNSVKPIETGNAI